MITTIQILLIVAQQKNNCLVDENFQLDRVIYKALLISDNNVMQQIGSISKCFKIKYYEHKASFPSKPRKIKPKNCTELANYLQKLNGGNKQYEISWKILHSTKTSGNPLSLCYL